MQFALTMSHSAPDEHRTIQPVPTVSIEAADSLKREDDSYRPVSGPDGFTSDTHERHAGIPWEQRPLSRRGILGWTIGALVGLVVFVTTVALALARGASNHAAQEAVAVHGAEPTDIAPAAQPEQARAPVQQNAAAASESPTPVPLEALPKVVATPPQKVTTSAPHPKVAAHKARKAPALAVKAPAKTAFIAKKPAKGERAALR